MALLEQVYMFIHKINEEDVKDYIFEEFQYKSNIDFRNYQWSDAQTTATSLARKLKYMDDESEVSEIIRAPFVYENLDRMDIMKRLQCLNPENMYVIHHSMSHKDLKEQIPDKFQKEKWFQRDFTV